MATTKIRSSSITDGQVANADLSATVAVTGGQIADDAITLAKMAGGTDGNLITYDASGDPAYVATGAATNVLTSNGAGAAPTFQAAAAGGKVLQVLEHNLATVISSTSTSYVASGLTITMTPASISSKFLLTLAGGESYNDISGGYLYVTFYVNGSEVSDTGPYEQSRWAEAHTRDRSPHSAMCLHAPASISDQTYTVYYKVDTGTGYFNSTIGIRVEFSVMELSS
jgi:hypothetical protein